MNQKKSGALYQQALSKAQGRRPNWKTVLEMLERASRQGSREAAYALATWYLHGKDGVLRKNVAAGTKLLRMSANRGYPQALYDLGVSYDLGIGVKENAERAFMNYLEAALRGDADATFEVATCFFHGDGIQQNKKLAMIYFKRAMELGSYKKDRSPLTIAMERTLIQ